MKRRNLLLTGAGALGVAAFAGTATTAVANAQSGKGSSVKELLWAAEIPGATDSYAAGFGNVQIQYGDGEIENDGPGMPVVEHPLLGPALEIHLEENQTRNEAAPGAGDDCGEGQELFFRVDFALDAAFPIDQEDPFCIINQIHQGSDSGSPPIEFDVHTGGLSVRGDSDAYDERLADIAVDTAYSLVYRVRFSTDPANSLLEVWLNGQQVLPEFQVPCATMNGGNSYWKGATMYASSDIPPLTVFQNAHRVGTTYEAVTQ